jgi:uncharacterized protein (DUF1810 family)
MTDGVDRDALSRFIEAQEQIYESVFDELAAGAKRTHWMWFIFPQLEQLGRSATARRFGIRDREEAAAYSRHPLLGTRLRDCSRLVLGHRDKTVHQIFGSPDDLKLRSCMTLFEIVANDEPVFGGVLDLHYAGARDEATINLLR